MGVVSTLLPRNEGSVDRVVRVVLGVALLGVGFGGLGWPWVLVGLLPLATGLLGSCPAYRVLGLSTRRTGKEASTAARPSR